MEKRKRGGNCVEEEREELRVKNARHLLISQKSDLQSTLGTADRVRFYCLLPCFFSYVSRMCCVSVKLKQFCTVFAILCVVVMPKVYTCRAV